ncbi:MAG TPA: hypothetical protein DCF63_09000 [Planctomycetaceae bacterium]|nr:hypothetical protein [Planctomycetaceae bacterium]
MSPDRGAIRDIFAARSVGQHLFHIRKTPNRLQETSFKDQNHHYKPVGKAQFEPSDELRVMAQL